MPDWNAAQYLQFRDERTRPARDLAARLASLHPQKILDIGCGPGNSTAALARQFPEAHILGIDNSPNMVAAARQGHPALEFRLCDAASGLGALDQDFDIVFSNACIQWITGHPQLLRNMMALLQPGGTLAVQLPVNRAMQNLLSGLAQGQKWSAALAGIRDFYTLPAAEYFDLLPTLSSDCSVWQTTYFHRMQSHEDILDWYRATGLRPYLAVLPDEQKAAFEADVLQAVRAAYPARSNGDILFPFPRLFFTATR